MRFNNYALLALTVVLSSLAGASAIGADKQGHAVGKFRLELGGNKGGLVKSVEGGQTTPEKVKNRPTPAAQNKPPVLPQAAIQPRPAVDTIQPHCPTPPCYLKNSVETKRTKRVRLD